MSVRACPVGGRLRLFRDAWAASIRDAWTISTISDGHTWTFITIPRERFMATRMPATAQKREALQRYVQDLITQQAVTTVPPADRGKGVYSPLFLVRKRSGAWRPVIDLTYLNTHIRLEKFKMESLFTIRQAVLPGDWMLSIDLRDAYFHVPVVHSLQKYLRFQVGHLHLQFACLPFGLCTSPRTFSKVLLAVVALLRARGLRLFHYLDDLLLLSQDRSQLLRHRDETVSTLEHFGWIINTDKSHLSPTRNLIYLGAAFNTERGTIALPKEKKLEMQRMARHYLSLVQLSAHSCLKIIGHMSATIPMVKWAQWRMRPFQRAFLRQWNSHNLAQRIHLSAPMRHSLLWWLNSKNLSRCLSLAPARWTVITSDASSTGWGAHCGHHLAQGKWDFPTKDIVSNVLELRAAYKALRSFAHLTKKASVLLRLDNTTAVAYIRKQGGTRSDRLLQEVAPIMSWAQSHLENISAVYIPGPENVQADLLSRTSLTSGEWSLHQEVFQWILSLGPTPEVDLFATYDNRKLQRFYSRFGDPRAFGVDALSDPWNFRVAYAFPPVPLITRFLQRLRRSQF